MRQYKKRVLSTLFVTSIFSANSFADTNQTKASPAAVKNIIMVVADGMGPVYPVLYRNFKDDPKTNRVEETVFDRLLVGTAATYPHITSGFVTDSAASATALATGVKTYNGAIGVDINKKPLLTVLEYAKIQGMRTGLVSTSQIVHATPASYIAKNESRRNYNDIADDFFDNRAEGKIVADVMIGGGVDYFIRDDRNLVQEFTDSGYQYVDTFPGLSVLKPGSQTNVLALLADVALPAAMDSEFDTPLLTMSKAAIEQLENNQHGYFLLIEASQVDWAGHANDIAYAMAEMEDLATTMSYLESYVQQHQDTLVVLTADHNTGGVSIGAKGKYQWQGKWLKNLKMSPAEIARTIREDAISKSQIEALLGFSLTEQQAKDLLSAEDNKHTYIKLKAILDQKTHTGWTTGGHTGVDVPVYATGPGAEKFFGHQDNTDIGKQVFQILNHKD
ncbi:alkaline phosphatase [Thalassotalea mangrovi]|uniref:Alkaline phosphatase n=1 Tax=Thalassotalea mangrovi TaxID=2572245 RepID=A0A4U1B1L8_9GAMM|nr:alkaline phosphatase [Thalassotalea mangrovi]TKB43330.1 alkaline phosphatase [Thalassotalea mangrovi]